MTTPDLGRLTKVLEKAEARQARCCPPAKKPLWVTEFWYDTNPPDPNGMSLDQQARWYEQDLYLFWKQGAEVAIALQLRDAPEGKSYAFDLPVRRLLPRRLAEALGHGIPLPVRRPPDRSVQGRRLGNRSARGARSRSRRSGAAAGRRLASMSAKGPGQPFTGEVQLCRFAKLRGP